MASGTHGVLMLKAGFPGVACPNAILDELDKVDFEEQGQYDCFTNNFATTSGKQKASATTAAKKRGRPKLVARQEGKKNN